MDANRYYSDRRTIDTKTVSKVKSKRYRSMASKAYPLRILYLAHRIPYPPNKGDKIRSFHQIRHLSKMHTIHLACLIDEKEDIAHIKTLEKYCASVDVVYRDKTSAKFLAILALLTHKSLSVASFYSKALEKKIVQWLNSEKFDIIIAFSSVMAWYVRHVTGIPKVIDFIDVDSKKWGMYADHHQFPISWIYRIEACRLARYDAEMAATSDHSLFVSEKEASLFRRQATGQPISVIPNGVDLDYFNPKGNALRSDGDAAIVFTGAMDYFPNIDAVRYFCDEVLPIVRKAFSEVRFYIVGRNPTRQVKALGRQANVIVTGSVPDIRPYLSKATVAVAPFRIARGVQNKILEAMSMGVPVVGTSIAFQGIQATPADGILIANDPEGFAQEVLLLLKDQNLRCQCSIQTRNYVLRNHQWEKQVNRLDFLLQETIRRSLLHADTKGCI